MITTKPISEIHSKKLLTEKAISLIKTTFEQQLSVSLQLTKISAPTVVLKATGINDDLNGTERPVSFPIKAMQERQAEVVQSLAKWKRLRLKDYDLPSGTGILTDMKALRPDEELTPLHSISVDQWDWELVMQPKERSLEFLKAKVQTIYAAMRETERILTTTNLLQQPILPQEITFIHSEDLLKEFPHLPSKERENCAAKEFGAIFLIGIGGELENGAPHDDRAPDYDDWSTATPQGTTGLNGDIIFWNPILEQAFEISSMGIRVDPATMERQLKIRKAGDKRELFFHQQLLAGELPQTIGGGIGQSRLCMFLLQKRHIGEVQVSIWPEELRADCAAAGIQLL